MQLCGRLFSCLVWSWLAGVSWATSGTVCENNPKPSQFWGQYSGFVILHSHRKAISARSDSLSALADRVEQWSIENVTDTFSSGELNGQIWRARCNLFRATNRFWETYIARFELSDGGGRLVEFTTRGIRPSNTGTAFVKGTRTTFEDFEATAARWPPTLSSWIGVPSWLSADASDTHAQASATVGAETPPSSQGIDPHAPDANAPTDSNNQCHISGTIDRYSFELDDGEATGPPLEVSSRSFNRSPDLVARLTLTDSCQTSVKSLSFAFRKFGISYFRAQQTRIGTFISAKTVIELYLFHRQYRKIEGQRAMLKVSWITLTFCILFDAFEAGFFFGRQDLGNDLALFTPLAAVAVLKYLLIIAFQLRWLISLWKEAAIHRRQMLGDANRTAWIGDVNRLMSWYALSIIPILFIIFGLFETFPEFVLLPASFFLVPQILKNIYSGTRHPFTLSFLFGLVLCRLALPYLLWSSTARELFTGVSKLDSAATEHTPSWPSWFAGESAPNIPMIFLDSIFGSIPHRLNKFMLSCVALISGTQAVYMVLQNQWSPRLGVPRWFCDRFLPVVFDYELDVARCAAAKQAIDPDLMGVDCVICMTCVKFKEVECVVTPCEHFFHKSCLIKWMDVKLECPTCRRPLPPI